MPPRSSKMKRFIFGFQRRVWWPKCTPASSSSFMETTATIVFLSVACDTPTCADGTRERQAPPSGGHAGSAGRVNRGIVAVAARRGRRRLDGRRFPRPAERVDEVVGQRGLERDPLVGERVVEREPVRMEELPLEREV